MSFVSDMKSYQKQVDRPVYVAFTNTRYGKVANVSLVRKADCGNNSQYCRNQCYGVRNFQMYQATRDAWSANSKHFHNDPIAACKQVEDALLKRQKNSKTCRRNIVLKTD